MKAITFEAPQSRNLSIFDLNTSLFKSVSKYQARRLWLRLNLAIRTWSRRTVAMYGSLLLAIASVAAFAGFCAAILENDTLTAIFITMAVAALAPEMTKMTYEQTEEEL